MRSGLRDDVGARRGRARCRTAVRDRPARGTTRPESLDSRTVGRRWLSEYGALRSLPKRVARQALGAAWTIGLPEVVLRGRATLPAGARRCWAISREVLGEPALTFATACAGSGRSTRRCATVPSDGTPVAYAKISWDNVTTSQVRAESDALALVATGTTDSLHAPGLLHAGQWQHLELCVTAPLPRQSKRVPPRSCRPCSRYTRSRCWTVRSRRMRCGGRRGGSRSSTRHPRSKARRPGSARRSTGWRPTWGRSNSVPDAGTALGLVEHGRGPGRALRLGLGVQPARSSVPFDLLHFFFQDAFVARSQPLLTAFSDTANAGQARTVSTRARHKAQATLRRSTASRSACAREHGVSAVPSRIRTSGLSTSSHCLHTPDVR